MVVLVASRKKADKTFEENAIFVSILKIVGEQQSFDYQATCCL
jgi:hypothetical protein